LLVKGIVYIEKQGLAMQLGKEGVLVATLLRNHRTFGRVTRQEGNFEHNSFHVMLESLIDNALKSCIFFKGGVLTISGRTKQKSD
jgi:hypothetical protein